MAVLELRYPGGAERRGILGLTTTRGDRLFISPLGSPPIEERRIACVTGLIS